MTTIPLSWQATEASAPYNNRRVPSQGIAAAMRSIFSYSALAPDASIAAHERTDPLRAQFRALADSWHDETDGLSSPMRKYMHPAYQRIIAKGATVIPFILDDLRTRGGDWYYALELLNSGASPVPLDATGDIRSIKSAWLEWGRRKGYIN